MNLVYFGVGAVLLVAAITDLLWTTLWVDGGAGPLSARLTTRIWLSLRAAADQESTLLSLSGPIILVTTLFVWVGLLWIGWTFVFAASEQALVNTRTRGVSWAGRLYFVAYTMYTMGNGDYYPQGDVWQIATSFTTASGMLFVTLSVSYVLSVLGAVSNKRAFASSVTGLGSDSESLVVSGWDDRNEDFRDLDVPLNTLSSQLDQLAEQHQSYPILHYYHSERSEQASAIGVAMLDEALTVLRYGVPDEHSPASVQVESARSSVESYLRTLNSAFIEPAERPPPPADLDRLRAFDIPTVDDEEFESAVESTADRRRKLRGTINADGWTWPPAES